MIPHLTILTTAALALLAYAWAYVVLREAAYRERVALVPTGDFDPKEAQLVSFWDHLHELPTTSLIHRPQTRPVRMIHGTHEGRLVTLVEVQRSKANDVAAAAATVPGLVVEEAVSLDEGGGVSLSVVGACRFPLHRAAVDTTAHLAQTMAELSGSESIEVSIDLIPVAPYAATIGFDWRSFVEEFAEGLGHDVDLGSPNRDESDRGSPRFGVSILITASAPTKARAKNLVASAQEAFGPYRGISWSTRRSSLQRERAIVLRAGVVDITPLTSMLSPATSAVSAPVHRARGTVGDLGELEVL